jgi:nicotinamide-nucleotide amidase
LLLALAESCTGGGISETITEVPGCSAWFDCSFVTYSNAAKIGMLGVQPVTLTQYGAVSSQVALEMTKGVLANSQADLAIAVTGIAGPEGGSSEKPVGTVFIALQRRGQQGFCSQQLFSGDRQTIRHQVIVFCLEQALRLLEA